MVTQKRYTDFPSILFIKSNMFFPAHGVHILHEKDVKALLTANDFLEETDKYLKDNYVVVFGGGTGKPYFTTDTCATLRAIENKCDAIFVAKNGVDGIYSDDPRINKNATMYKTIKCSEIIAKDLKVMDLTAIKMLVDQDIDVRVFNMNDISNFYKIAKGEDIGTTILKG